MIIEDERTGKGIMIKRLGIFCLLFIAPLLFFTTAHGAEYPARAIQIVSPFPPGGQTDIIARFLNKKLSILLGQPIVVVNKSGGGGTVGIQSVASAPPDGYTILSSTPTILVAPLTIKGLPFTLKNFTPITIASSMPIGISVGKGAPWNTLEELIAEAKKYPGKLTYSSAGPGSLAHLAGELFTMVTGTNITHVPMEGTAKAITAVLGGHVSMNIGALGGLKSYFEVGSLRPLTVMSRNRQEQFPDVPTTAEKGYPKIINSVWQAFFVPVKTPPSIVKKLSEAFNKSLTDKEITVLIKKAGFNIDNLSPDNAARFLAEEGERVAAVIKVARIGE